MMVYVCFFWPKEQHPDVFIKNLETAFSVNKCGKQLLYKLEQMLILQRVSHRAFLSYVTKNLVICVKISKIVNLNIRHKMLRVPFLFMSFLLSTYVIVHTLYIHYLGNRLNYYLSPFQNWDHFKSLNLFISISVSLYRKYKNYWRTHKFRNQQLLSYKDQTNKNEGILIYLKKSATFGLKMNNYV